MADRRIRIEALAGPRPRFYRDPAVRSSSRSASSPAPGSSSGHVSQLPAPGSYLTATAGPEPVLVLRDDEGELRAFRNVCRHRGSRLLSGSGDCGKAIRCLYHGWTYRLDGAADRRARGPLDPGLDKSALGLFPARVEVMCGLVFVNLDIGRRAAGRAGGRPARAARALRHRASSSHCRSRPRSQPANWKIVVDNYLEGYHVPIAHPGLMRLLDYKRYDVERARRLGLVRGAAARQAVRQPDGARSISASSRRCRASPRRTGACGVTS